MIGLRFTECVRDIAIGAVRMSDVDFIYTGTICRNQFAWEALMESCQRKCWNGHGEKAVKVALELLDGGRIQQPRFTGKCPMVLNNCFWVISEQDIIWKRTVE